MHAHQSGMYISNEIKSEAGNDWFPYCFANGNDNNSMVSDWRENKSVHVYIRCKCTRSSLAACETFCINNTPIKFKYTFDRVVGSIDANFVQ